MRIGNGSIKKRNKGEIQKYVSSVNKTNSKLLTAKAYELGPENKRFVAERITENKNKGTKI